MWLHLWHLAGVLYLLAGVGAEDPYRFFTWNVTYGDIYPLGVRQQVCTTLKHEQIQAS